MRINYFNQLVWQVYEGRERGGKKMIRCGYDHRIPVDRIFCFWVKRRCILLMDIFFSFFILGFFFYFFKTS